jgi:hypothetical protein
MDAPNLVRYNSKWKLGIVLYITIGLQMDMFLVSHLFWKKGYRNIIIIACIIKDSSRNNWSWSL